MMARRFDIIAKAYPDHAQRIAEATYEWSENSFNWLFDKHNGDRTASAILFILFPWDDTVETSGYWFHLYEMGYEIK